VLAAAAVLFLAAAGVLSWTALVSQRDALAVVEAGESSIYRVARGETRRLRADERIAFGEVVRSNGGVGGMLRLADGSRVEMRSQSELMFERADDGVRIRLDKGGIIVNAAKQRQSHLYVQTRDVTVSVVGTVFLVDAGEAGSRVAVIEGEVRVQQGSGEQTLRPGEQVATNPSMPRLPLSEGVAWSRQAGAHVARLQQTLPQLQVRPEPKEEPLRFEVVSVRPSVTSSASGGRGDGPGGGSDVNQWGCGISSPTIDPRRFSVTKTTVHTLIVWAYGSRDLHAPGCGTESRLNLIFGEPDWIKTELFDVFAAIPEGVSTGTKDGRDAGQVTAIRRMLQDFLVTRFNLVVRRESREMPVYLLSVTRETLKSLESSGPAQWLTTGGVGPDDKLLGGSLRDPGVIADTGIRNGEAMNVLRGRNAVLADLATQLGPSLGRMVLDRTGLTGLFNFDFWVAPLENAGGPLLLFRSMPRATSPTIFAALADAGLRLEPSRVPLEVLVIDRVERPSQN
jgi:uncharacterized protein (TIGR03435 family)